LCLLTMASSAYRRVSIDEDGSPVAEPPQRYGKLQWFCLAVLTAVASILLAVRQTALERAVRRSG
jgi:hypothetical protein